MAALMQQQMEQDVKLRIAKRKSPMIMTVEDSDDNDR